jgi:hypothetical protein
VKFGDGHRPERDFGSAAIRCLADNSAIDEIKDDLDPWPIGYQ